MSNRPESIEKLSTALSDAKINLARFKRAAARSPFSNSASCGPGLDYNLNGFICGADSLLSVLSASVKSFTKLISLTTHDEREQIAQLTVGFANSLASPSEQLTESRKKKRSVPNPSQLKYLDDATGAENSIDLAGACATLERLKLLVRSFRVYFEEEHLSDLHSQLQELQRRKLAVDQSIEEVTGLAERSKEIVDALSEKNSDGDDELRKISELREEIEQIIRDARNRDSKASEQMQSAADKLANFNDIASEISQAKATIDAQGESVDAFIEKIEARERQLETQRSKTDVYEENLKRYGERLDSILTTLNQTSTEARNVLGTSTEVSLGRHFATQYGTARKHHSKWLVASGVLLAVALGLGVWAVLAASPESGGDIIKTVIARALLVPIALLGAGWCASQYGKQRRIIEDYAHKMVLAQSITAFRRELSEGGDEGSAQKLLDSVIQQIQGHPMRAEFGSASVPPWWVRWIPFGKLSKTEVER